MRSEYGQHLMFNGILIFMLGLFTGFSIYFGVFPNGRIGLVAHLECVLNGMFLCVVGLLWTRMDLSRRLEKLTLALALSAVYLNIAQALWWAFTGRSRASPVFPADRIPNAIDGFVFNVILPALSVAFIGACIMVLYGLRRGLAAQRAAAARQVGREPV